MADPLFHASDFIPDVAFLTNGWCPLSRTAQGEADIRCGAVKGNACSQPGQADFEPADRIEERQRKA